LVGDGSDEIITLLLTALSEPRPRSDSALVMTTTPTFVMYRMSARVREQRVLEVPLDAHWDLSLESMLRGIELTAEDQPGFWEERGYHKRGDPWAEERYSGGEKDR